jgi:predicted porin
MQKKVMAVAVAAALAGPATVLAQGSSVQIYGGISTSFEWAQAKGADTSASPGAGGSSLRAGNLGGGYVATGSSTPNVNEPSRTRTQGAGSNFGLRGREDLGNGLYMGFQAEASIAIAGQTAVSSAGSGLFASWRNTGVWLGGRWGEVGIGLWDLPFNMNMTTGAGHAAYANASTTMIAGLLGGGLGGAPAGTASGQDFSQFCSTSSGLVGTTAACFSNAASFHRRQSNQVWYQSPTWAGFRGRISYGATGGGTANATNDGANFPSQVKAQLWGVGVSYTLGGLYAGIGYEYHDDYITTAARQLSAGIAAPSAGCAGFGPGFSLGGLAGGVNTSGQTVSGSLACLPIGSAAAGSAGLSGDESTGWNFNLRYTFGFGLSIGGYYETVEWKMKYGNTTGAESGLLTKVERDAWRLDAAYQLGAHTFGIQWGQGRRVKGSTTSTAAAPNGFNGSGTGTDVWIFGYGYSLSKRSSLYAYYTYVDNETNSRSNGIVFNGIGPNAGADPKYLGVGLRHLF